MWMSAGIGEVHRGSCATCATCTIYSAPGPWRWPRTMPGEGKVMRATHGQSRKLFGHCENPAHPAGNERRPCLGLWPRPSSPESDRYGFPKTMSDLTSLRGGREAPIHFKAIANVTGFPYRELKVLNPELRRDATPRMTLNII